MLLRYRPLLISLLLPLLLLTCDATVKSKMRSMTSLRKLIVTLGASATLSIPAVAVDISLTDKQLNLSPQTFSRIVADDISVRQALVTADFTRSIYSEDCKFTDEVDTYEIDKYISGTKALFNAGRSHVDLVGDVSATPELATFKFSEKLTFNIPVLNPYVYLTGRVELKRGPDGLVQSSREFWDEKPSAVILKVKLDI